MKDLTEEEKIKLRSLLIEKIDLLYSQCIPITQIVFISRFPGDIKSFPEEQLNKAILFLEDNYIPGLLCSRYKEL